MDSIVEIISYKKKRKYKSAIETLDFENVNNLNIVSGFGFIVEYKKTNYIITCNHLVPPSFDRIVAIDTIKKKQYNLKVMKNFYEIDIAILEIFDENNLKPITYKKNYKSRFDELHVLRKKNKCEYSKLILNDFELGIMNINTTMFSSFTYFSNIEKSLFENIYSGLSGSLLFDENNIPISIFHGYSSYKSKSYNTIKTIPLFVVMETFYNFMDYKITSLHSIIINYDTVKINFEDTIKTCIIVKDTTNNYINGKKNLKFQKNNIIISIDDLEINKNGKIYVDEFNDDISVNSYFLFKSLDINHIFKIRYGKYTKKEKFTITNTYIKPIPINDMFKINISDSNTIFIHENLIFLELSDQILNFYDKLGLHLFNSKITNTFKNFDEEKYVIVINMDKLIIKDNMIDFGSYTNILKKNKFIYFDIVKKINNTKIKNINDVIRKMNNKKIKIEYFKF